MADTIGEAFVAIRPDVSGFQQEAATGLKSSLGKVAAGIGGLLVLNKVKDQITDTINAGSALNETVNKTAVVFGDSSKAALAYGDTAASSLGESKQAALEQLSTLGNLFVSLGLGRRKALDMGKGMVSLAADLGSFNNVPTDEALEAIRSGLVGETEPLRRFGVNMNEATLKAKALALGIADGTAQLTPAQRAQAAYALILDQTKTAQGDFARTADGAANSQKTLQANTDDLRASIGTALLPVYKEILEVGNKIVGYLREHQGQAKILAIIVGTTLVAAFTAWAVSAIGAAFATLVAMAPVLIVLAAVGLAIADAIALWDRFGPAVEDAVNSYVVPALNAVIGMINGVIDTLNLIPGVNIGHVGEIGGDGEGGAQQTAGPLGYGQPGTGLYGTGPGGPNPNTGQQTAGPLGMGSPNPYSGVQQILDYLGSLPSYGMGGMVPGALGQKRMIYAHGGEQVLTPEQQSAWGGNVHLHYERMPRNGVQIAVDAFRGLRAARQAAAL